MIELIAVILLGIATGHPIVFLIICGIALSIDWTAKPTRTGWDRQKGEWVEDKGQQETRWYYIPKVEHE